MDQINNTTVSLYRRGFGVLGQDKMRQQDLPLLAKSIYAYLCSYVGNRGYAYPKQEKMKTDLKIGLDTLQKYLKLLAQKEWIVLQRTPGGNRYFVQNPWAVDQPQEASVKKMGGYGKIPKTLMLDPRLSAQAKGIYAYLCTYAGSKTFAFPRQSTILRDLSITKNTYYQHVHQLIDTGYLVAEQQKKGGRFGQNLYHLVTEIGAILPAEKTVASAFTPTPQKGRPEKLPSYNPLFPIKQTSLNKNKINKNNLKNDLIGSIDQKKFKQVLDKNVPDLLTSLRYDDLMDDLHFLKDEWPKTYAIEADLFNHQEICDHLINEVPKIVAQQLNHLENQSSREQQTLCRRLSYDRISICIDAILKQADHITYPVPYIHQAFSGLASPAGCYRTGNLSTPV